ncbi:MAG: 50S ribosomal protein L9 [Bacillota bacterium]|nr:50S ribosomal protein L9 [Bacillota bacterium]
MKIILRQDVLDLGARGAVVNVADGYARNYLLPRGLAVPASESNLKQREQRITVQKTKTEKLEDTAQSLARRLDGLSITVRARTGEAGRLFGSVTAQDIVQGIEAVAGARVDRRKIEMPETIKATGTYRVQLRLHPKITVSIEVRVVAA